MKKKTYFGSFLRTIRKMKLGDSFLYAGTQIQAHTSARQTGAKVVTRLEPSGAFRVWLTRKPFGKRFAPMYKIDKNIPMPLTGRGRKPAKP